METPHPVSESELFAISRPAPVLLTYYAVSSLLLGPFFFFALIPMYFRYHTLRYRFDSEGISMRWGILFRREINLTYARIQDIHLRSNLLERWLGLARIEVQTASGSSGAEMTLEGLLEYEAIRDYLYSRMRGSHGSETSSRPRAVEGGSTALSRTDAARLVEVFRDLTTEIRALREQLERRGGGGTDD